jgi:hypothetical protein
MRRVAPRAMPLAMVTGRRQIGGKFDAATPP